MVNATKVFDTDPTKFAYIAKEAKIQFTSSTQPHTQSQTTELFRNENWFARSA